MIVFRSDFHLPSLFSLLEKYADIFGFNLPHEIGHILLHSKRNKFIKYYKRELSTQQEKELEEDEYSGNTLIPLKRYQEFVIFEVYSAKAVLSFAKKIGIDPGIVEGRRCHEGRINWKNQLGFRARLQFAEG